MILPFLTQNVMHAWQVVSICCKSSAYEQAKLVKCFQFYYFLLNRETNTFPSMRCLISSVYKHCPTITLAVL